MKITNYISALTLSLMITSLSGFAQQLTIDTENSRVEWIGKKLVGQHEGLINIKEGSLELKDDQLVGGSFTLDMKSITCTDLEDEGYNQKLVGHLNSDDFFGVDLFPEATFEITTATKFAESIASITGILTIKGKSESITFDVVRNNNIYTATLNVDRSKYDVKYGSASFFDSLGDNVIDDIFILDIKLTVD
jgi:polyisoprenoid-binding protein YceI